MNGSPSRHRVASPGNRMLQVGDLRRAAPTAWPEQRVVRESRTAAIALATARPWDANRLRSLVAATLGDDQLIVVSNRQPFSHEHHADGVRLTRPAGGMVAALEPVVRGCAGTWVAHGSGSADHVVVDGEDVWQTPPELGAYRLRRLWLSAEEQQGYCDGFANSGLWPLCHMAHVRPSFTERDWQAYRSVNRRFADAVVDEACQSDPVVLIQDYHLALVGQMVRSRLPDATIVSFWHVPWLSPQRMSLCPWLPALVDGLLGSDIVGFQTPEHRRNFLACASPGGVEAHPADSPGTAHPGRRSLVRDYPISIAWPTAAEKAEWPDIAEARRHAAQRFDLPDDGRLIVGIDRFDYTKGLLERLRAVEQLLASSPGWRGRLRFVQVAAPTRTSVAEYGGFRVQVMAAAERINRRFAADGPPPVRLLDVHHDPAEVTALYRAADLCLVTSLHDGMNLVCKEFIAARDDEQGVVVLSRYACAAHELSQALVVDPHHTFEVAEALDRALSMPADEQRRRMRSLRATVEERNVYHWAASLLLDAGALRRAWRAPVQASTEASLATSTG